MGVSLQELERLFKEYSQMVFAVCFRYTRSNQAAEDLMQEIFIKMHESKADFGHQSKISTWIYRISVNTCLDYLRQQKRRGELVEENIADIVKYNLSKTPEFDSADNTFQNLIEKVNDKDREILFLIYFEGLSNSEVARVLNVSRSAITLRLRNLKKVAKDAGF